MKAPERFETKSTCTTFFCVLPFSLQCELQAEA